MERLPWLVVGLSVVLFGCESAPTDTPVAVGSPVLNAAQAPTEQPLFEEFDDLNPCTGQTVHYTFTGTARIQEFDGHFVLVGQGTVETSDGFSGSFNRTWVFQGDQVTTLRFHDMEISNGQRIIAALGLFHEITVDGQIEVSFVQFSGLRCVGNPAA